MKRKRLAIVVCLSLTCSLANCLLAQKMELALRFDVYDVPIRLTQITRETGMDYYDVEARQELNNALYTDITWWPTKSIGFSAGGGIHSYKYRAEYTITNPIEESEILFDNYRVFSAFAWGPTCHLNFKKGKWRAKVGGFIAFEPFRFRRSHDPIEFLGFFFDPIDHTSAALAINEGDFMSPFPSAYSLVQLLFQYRFAPNLHVNIGVEETLGQKYDTHYKLYVTGHTESTTDETHELNNFELSTKYNALSISITYDIVVKKQDPVRD